MDLNSPIIHSSTGGPDAGISYAASTNAIQNLLDKLKKPFKKKPTDQGADEGTIAGMNALLNDLIQFEYPESVLKSVWRKIKKPSPETVSKIRDRYGNPFKKWAEETDPHIHDITKGLSKMGLSAILDNLINFQDPRPRNPLGEFSPQGEEGPSPNSMAIVYKQPQPTGPSLTQAGGLALTGGALGAVGAAGGKHAYHVLNRIAKNISKRKASRIIRP